MAEIVFDMIDCKDGYFILGTDADYILRTNKNNLEVIAKARLKYLKGLVELQEEIRQEFEPQLVVITEENALPKDKAHELRDEIDSKYPVRDLKFRRLFYT
jgi:hypothetical protein